MRMFGYLFFLYTIFCVYLVYAVYAMIRTNVVVEVWLPLIILSSVSEFIIFCMWDLEKMGYL